MLGELFAGNIIVVLIVTVIIITSYSHFEENQQIFLIYLMFYGLAYFKIIRVAICAIYLLIITFVYLEYLSVDKKKLELITSFWYKAIDYMFLMVFQLHVIGLFVSMILLFLSHITSKPLNIILVVTSFLIMAFTEHLVVTQPFKIKNITDIEKTFSRDPYYRFKCSAEAYKRYSLLCCFEDKRYFLRSKSYSTYSLEYLNVYGKNRFIKKLFFGFLNRIKLLIQKQITIKKILPRGYASPEMQLIRTIGIKRGYNNKFHRKVFEILYSKIFFASLEKYNLSNSTSEDNCFREYILDIYLKNVLTIIHGRRFSRLCDAFENPKDVSTWPLEGLFVACLGLNFKRATPKNISLRSNIVVCFDLDIDKIYEYSRMIEGGKSIPCINNKNNG